MVPALRVDVGRRRALGLGSLSLWSLGLLRRWLVLDAAWLQELLLAAQLVATRSGRLRPIRSLLRQSHSLVSARLQSARPLRSQLSKAPARPPDPAALRRGSQIAAHKPGLPSRCDDRARAR